MATGLHTGSPGLAGAAMRRTRGARWRTAVLLCAAAALWAVMPCRANEDEDLLRKRTEYTKSELRLRVRAEEFARAESLLMRGLIPQLEYEQKRLALLLEMSEHEHARATLLGTGVRTWIDEAVRWETEQGEIRVRIRLRATSEDPSEKAETTLPIILSLKDGNTIVGRPYELLLGELEFGRSETAEFSMLRDLDVVRIEVRMGLHVTSREVLLRRDVGGGVFALVCPLSAQEAPLGSTVRFPLTIETTDALAAVELRVEGLPAELDAAFYDPATGARVSQVPLRGGERSRRVDLAVSIPERIGASLAVDEIVRFACVAAVDGETQRAELELVPRGRGRLEVITERIYYEGSFAQGVRLNGRVRNAGTRRVDAAVVLVDPPPGWEIDARRRDLPPIEPDDEREFTVVLTPRDEAGPGEYEVVIRAEGAEGSGRVFSPLRTVRLHRKGSHDLATSLGLVMALVVAIAGVVYIGVRLSRRET